MRRSGNMERRNRRKVCREGAHTIRGPMLRKRRYVSPYRILSVQLGIWRAGVLLQAKSGPYAFPPIEGPGLRRRWLGSRPIFLFRGKIRHKETA